MSMAVLHRIMALEQKIKELEERLCKLENKPKPGRPKSGQERNPSGN